MLKKKGKIREWRHQLLRGDCLKVMDHVPDESCRLVITSPPYNIGKQYERGKRRTLDEYISWLKPIFVKACDKVVADGHICWQVGNHVNKGEIIPLDYIIYQIARQQGLKLRNRIIWHFNFGLHASRRFSGRYETLLWFTKSDDYYFNLDPVRVPQLYPGKRHSSNRRASAGLPSGNPKGKNPSDFWSFDAAALFQDCAVWELPNVKANHPEKTIHPCQFPSELVERCILAFTKTDDIILDPFVGTGTTVIAAEKHGRRGIGIEQDTAYIGLARRRLAQQRRGTLTTRPLGKPVRAPKPDERVATTPPEWQVAAE